MSGGARRTAGLAIALLAVLALVACGGEASDTEGASSADKDSVETGPLKVVGGGAAAYKATGRRLYVPTWGSEADKAELKAAATAMHDFLVALAEEDWAEACEHVSGIQEQLLKGRSPRFASRKCAQILPEIKKLPLEGSAYESSEVEAESLRSDGPWAFLLYRAATAPFYMPMLKERGGEWKVNLIEPQAFNR